MILTKPQDWFATIGFTDVGAAPPRSRRTEFLEHLFGDNPPPHLTDRFIGAEQQTP